jgi:Heterokaryon incompatibility protein (HET)
VLRKISEVGAGLAQPPGCVSQQVTKGSKIISATLNISIIQTFPPFFLRHDQGDVSLSLSESSIPTSFRVKEHHLFPTHLDPPSMEVAFYRGKKRGYAQFLEHDSVLSTQNAGPQLVSPERDELCSRCRALDLEAIFQMKIKVDRGSFITDLGASGATLKTSDCVMCRLFGSMSPSDFDDNGLARNELCHLRAFSANRVFSRLPASEMGDIHDVTLMGVVRVPIRDVNSGKNNSRQSVEQGLEETGYICSIQAGHRESILRVRVLSPTSFDVERAMDCLVYCLANHRLTCSTIEASPVETLRVIDCQTRTIIRAPAECQYVALSYVWGSSTTSITSTMDQTTQSTIQNAPKVINDAIDVTLKLGLQYLWIDRYCIDQSNKDDKHSTIRVMDMIYANARLTIIAAAGSNPDYGLPGVGGTFRKLQSCLKVGTHFMVSTMPHPRWSIQHSKWASRGWTYQEGLFSKRRLIFTDHQILYECNGMHCTESLVLPLGKLHVKSKKEYKVCVPHGAFVYKDPGKKPWEIMSYVAEFSKRHLTFPSDALNAMQGIFNSFSRGRRPLYQLAGVPIPPPEAAINYHTLYKSTNRTPKESFLIGLSWYHIKPGGRRQSFPTWSWAGWVGELSLYLMFSFRSLERLNNVRVWIEDDDGSLLTFPSSERLGSFLKRDYCKNRFIHIEALTIQFSVVYLRKESILSRLPKRARKSFASWMERDGYYAMFHASDGTIIYARVHLDQREQDFCDTYRERP